MATTLAGSPLDTGPRVRIRFPSSGESANHRSLNGGAEPRVSNPVPSTGESGTNLTSSLGGRGKLTPDLDRGGPRFLPELAKPKGDHGQGKSLHPGGQPPRNRSRSCRFRAIGTRWNICGRLTSFGLIPACFSVRQTLLHVDKDGLNADLLAFFRG